MYGVKPTKSSQINYFSVKACADKIISYASEKNGSAVFNILNKEYRDQNNITASNIFEKAKLDDIKKYKVKAIYELARKQFLQTLYAYFDRFRGCIFSDRLGYTK